MAAGQPVVVLPENVKRYMGRDELKKN